MNNNLLHIVLYNKCIVKCTKKTGKNDTNQEQTNIRFCRRNVQNIFIFFFREATKSLSNFTIL